MNLTEKFLAFALTGAEWVLWLLVILSVISVYVMIERVLFLRSAQGSDRDLEPTLRKALVAGDRAAAATAVAQASGPGGTIVRELIAHGDADHGALEAVINSVRPGEKLRLEKNLSFLGTVGSNSPFIGLFGTVLGIMKAFKDLAASGVGAADNSSVVMAGISEALVATAVGLLVAIPAVIAYNFLQRTVKAALARADGLSQLALSMLASGHSHGGADRGGDAATTEAQ